MAGEIEKAVEMRERLNDGLALIGFELEEKHFRPHLTIGRVKSNRKTSELLALVDARQVPALSFVVTEIVLMKSELHPAGARYTPIAKVSLS